MDTSTFKKILDNFLIQKEFQKKSGQYYLSSREYNTRCFTSEIIIFK